MTRSDFHPYQEHALQHLLEHPAAALLMDMGLGKSVVTLTALDELLKTKQVKKILVVAPKRVAQDTWTREANKWDHLRHLTISPVLGTEKQRRAGMAAKADIYIINRENVAWLVGHYQQAWPFDTIVIDELSSFKSNSSTRFKALRSIRPRVQRVIGLTGTPAPNGLLDLWAQVYLLDRGERLGPTIGGYREKYFKADKRNAQTVFSYKLDKEVDPLLGEDINREEIYSRIGDICISMKAKDFLDLPARIDQDVFVDLSPEQMKAYKEFERDQVLELIADGETVTATSAAALVGKLLQYANGAIYLPDKTFSEIHNHKLEALEEDLEAANGKPFLLFYQYRHDVERIKKQLKAYKPHLLDGPKDIAKWNNGEIPFMLCHAASAGHGLNLQDGGHLMGWFGLPWSLELYQQACARLDRQGQRYPVINRRYIVRGTMDEDVAVSLERKATGQNALLDAVKALIQSYM